jgi:hypothetical protein
VRSNEDRRAGLQRKNPYHPLSGLMDDLVSQFEIRDCLSCGHAKSVFAQACPRCDAVEHTRTFVIVKTSRNEQGMPVVRVENFGNEK